MKIALLSNFTINGLEEYINKKCQKTSININIYQSNYNQIYQEIFNENSNLKNFNPDITFILLNNKFILDDIKFDINNNIDIIDKKSNEFEKIINGFLQNISGTLVISNLQQDYYSIFGICEDKIKYSYKECIDYINKKIKYKFINETRVRIYDFNSLFLKFGYNNIINDKMQFLGDIYISQDYIEYLAEDLMGYIKPFCSKNKKCIVLDLDNTLWGGIIGEDGFDNIKLDKTPPGNTYFEFQKYLLALNQRGIILAINSKNNYEDAINVIKNHPYMLLREENFASIKINWNNKVDNIIEISNDINIGIDSLIFIDDDPINREMVKENLLNILVINLPKDPSLYVKTLKNINDINVLQLTNEDFNKKDIYYQQRQRNELKEKISNLDNFLASLDMEVNIKKANNFYIPRISQLTKKTNQFNLTTKRYSEEDINNFSINDNYYVYCVNVKDKFGDNGITGVFIIEKENDNFIIDTFLLSCRIIGRNIEKVMLNFIINLAIKNNINKIIGKYYPTQKNKQVENFYINNKFIKINENKFELNNFENIENIDYIKINEELT